MRSVTNSVLQSARIARGMSRYDSGRSPNSNVPRHSLALRRSSLGFIASAIVLLNGVIAGPQGVRSQEPSVRILILNSDMAIRKYLDAQSAFKSTISRPTVEVDLGKKWRSEDQIERTIRSHDPEILYCIGSRAYLLATRLDNNKAIVLSSVINWERFPSRDKTFVIANELPAASQLTMFRYFFPNIQTIGVLYNPAFNQTWIDNAVREGRDVNIQVVGKAVAESRGVEAALQEVVSRIDALWVTSDPVVLSSQDNVEQIFRLADLNRRPVFAYSSAFSNFGATLILSADTPTIGRQAAGMVEDFLLGKSFDGTSNSPAGSEIILNLKRVETYGIEFNEEALDSVNRILR